MNETRFKAVVIGTSSGGLLALKQIIPALPAKFLPVIIVMHMKADSDNYLVHYLAELSQIKVKEAQCHEKIKKNTVYICPPGYHLQIEPDRTFSLSLEPPVRFCRPSIDVLFESAAIAYQEHLIGVVLTGANDDGSLGLAAIKERGGLAIVQDPKTAQAQEMPKSAIERCEADYVVELGDISTLLATLNLTND